MLSLSLTSCRKTPGCMDQDADNFSIEAEEDDGTCYYSGGSVFYHDQQTSQNLIADGISFIKFYVDGVFYDQVSANIYWSTIPSCQSDQAFTIENYGLANSKSKQFNYTVKDQDNQIIGSGTFSINANTCSSYTFDY